MKELTERPKILIISGYHSKEIFAVKVGEELLHHFLNSDVKVVKYLAKFDCGTRYNLRKFIKKFNPVISPIILHSDNDLEVDAAIIYLAKSKLERKKALRPLKDFCIRYIDNGLVVFGIVCTPNANFNLIDLELNPNMSLENTIFLIKDFVWYLLHLLEGGIKL